MPDSSTILAIETATPIGSVALLHEGRLSELSFGKPHQQAAQLLPLIEQLLEDVSISYADLNGLAVTVGPGSFTGIRIGLAAARTITMSFPAIKPIPFTTLECLASTRVMEGKPVFATLNAGKGQIYCQHYDASGAAAHQLIDPAMVDFGCDAVVGNSRDLLPENMRAKMMHPELPSAGAMLTAIQAGFTPAPRDMKPLYIREPDAELSTKPLL